VKQVLLPDGTRTSQIGLGCANLFAGPGQDAANRLVGAALDAGIRHFDTAPAYGSGTSEDALAAALEGRGEGVTITTKLGIVRPSQTKASAGLWLRQTAKAALAFAPGLKARLGQRAYQMARQSSFALDALEASLTESLRRLRRNRVDVLLLHEPEPADVTDELARWIEDKVAQGRAGSVGFGVKRSNFAQVLQGWPSVRFIQTEWLPDEALELPGQRESFVSLHGAVRHRGTIEDRVCSDTRLRDMLAACGIDSAAPDGSARAALALALGANPDGLLLVSSSRTDRIAFAALTRPLEPD
jgi:hypothetical protein